MQNESNPPRDDVKEESANNGNQEGIIERYYAAILPAEVFMLMLYSVMIPKLLIRFLRFLV